MTRKSKKATCMKMAEVQAGVGFGVKRFRLVWVFEKKSDMYRFANCGWEVGAQSTELASAIKSFDPGNGWKAVDPD